MTGVLERTGRRTEDAAGSASSLAGTATLVGLIARRDRVRLLAWAFGVVGILALFAHSVPSVYPTAADLQARGDFVQSPVLTIFSGPGYGADAYTVGAMVANEYLIYGLVAVALFSIFSVVRHTRAEEETGRAELLRAAPLGRHATTTAAMVVVAAANVVIGAATAVVLGASLEELSVAGSWAFGMALATTGILFAAVAAVAAQLTEHSRGAAGAAMAVLAVAFTLRAIGDVGDERTLSWVSPLGWAQSTRAYVDERWWPLLLSLAAAGVLTTVAFALVGRRDLGAGFVRPRPGPASASRWLATPGGLGLRLQRASLVAWGTGLALLGAAFGSVVGDVTDVTADNPQLQEFFGTDDSLIVEAFLSTVVLLLALLATACAITAVLSMRREENDGQAEPVLATAVSRTRWATGHLAVALLGGAAVLLCASAAVGAAVAIDTGEVAWFYEVVATGAAHLPALWLSVAVVAALYGLARRAAPWGWAVLAYVTVVGLLGDLLDLPEPVRPLSPFHHVPDVLGDGLGIAAPVILTVAAGALIALGLAALGRRDMATT
ncbi:MAG: hypothetical protein JJU45_18575 [Acidimicrobiia bacterium]|nr:hypothetical protein [Acidimicrobiia bacterium]